MYCPYMKILHMCVCDLPHLFGAIKRYCDVLLLLHWRNKQNAYARTHARMTAIKILYKIYRIKDCASSVSNLHHKKV